MHPGKSRVTCIRYICFNGSRELHRSCDSEFIVAGKTRDERRMTDSVCMEMRKTSSSIIFTSSSPSIFKHEQDACFPVVLFRVPSPLGAFPALFDRCMRMSVDVNRGSRVNRGSAVSVESSQVFFVCWCSWDFLSFGLLFSATHTHTQDRGDGPI